MNGKFDAATLKGIIDAALVKSGVLSDKQSNISWNLATGAFTGKKVTITNLTATSVSGTTVEGETVSSGDGYTGSYHVDGATISVRAGIVTGKTEDEIQPPAAYSGTYHVDGATVTVQNGMITAVTPDPQAEPDPEPETPGGEEGDNS